MTVFGKVTAISDSHVSVVFDREGASCASCGACGHFHLFPLSSTVSMELENPGLSLRIDDNVRLEAKDHFFFMALLLVFIAPLAVMLLAAYLIMQFGSETQGVAGGFSCLFIYMFIILKKINSFFTGIFRITEKADRKCQGEQNDTHA